mmetsp:Transcript_48255/g.140673  ORF Transcript_48255/g.140673 Transcript_48255/m.140673 type:complete len:226 (+) Transcript_48255:124-801(+)
MGNGASSRKGAALHPQKVIVKTKLPESVKSTKHNSKLEHVEVAADTAAVIEAGDREEVNNQTPLASISMALDGVASTAAAEHDKCAEEVACVTECGDVDKSTIASELFEAASIAAVSRQARVIVEDDQDLALSATAASMPSLAPLSPNIAAAAEVVTQNDFHEALRQGFEQRLAGRQQWLECMGHEDMDHMGGETCRPLVGLAPASQPSSLDRAPELPKLLGRCR